MNLEVFANAVKDYDGTVDGIAYYRQQCCYEGGIHFHMEQGEIAQGNANVDNQSDNRCNSELKLEAQGDVGNHQEPGQHNGQHCLLNELATHGSAHVFHTLNSKIAQLALQVIHYCTAFFIVDDAGTNEHALSFLGIAVVAFQLDDAIAQIMSFQHIAHLRNLHGLIKGQVHDAAAGEVDAQIEALYKHGAKADDQKGNGNGKENLVVFNNGEFHYLATSLASAGFGARAPKRK